MARYTLVANSQLCPSTKSAFKVYYDLVDVFVDKYVGKASQTITVPVGEGKIEGFATTGKGGVRLDLQGTDNGYANFQAQFGTGHENCKKGGSYGGVLMCCAVPFTRAEFKEALKRSFGSGAMSLCKLDADTVEEVTAKVQSKGAKTKPGKQPWTPGTTYY